MLVAALSPLLPRSARGQARAPAAAFPEAEPAPAPSAAAPSAPTPAPSPPSATEPASPPTSAPPLPYPAPYPYPVPPPGYPYGYYYPALTPVVPAPPPPPRFADDAAVSSTPFFDAVIVAADFQNHISQSVSVGAQAGVFVAGRARLTAKIAFPTEGLGDQQADFGSEAKNPSFFYAFSAGVAALRTPTFVMSPGVMLARTDVSDYGTMLGLSLPLDWVMKSGLRLGLEGGLGRAFGGRRAVTCDTPGASDCSGQPKYEDRKAGTALWLQFQIGFGFNHPGPIPPAAGPPR